MENAVLILMFLAGIFLGVGVTYWYQRRCRMQELKNISRMAGGILEGQKLLAAYPGEETLTARIEHQLVRVQELLEGRRREAENSRDEIQKLISETAHQMRTPLANMETYLELLKEGDPDRETAGRAMEALEESRRKLAFLAENFIKMSRLEQGLIQIRKEEKNILDTVRNAFGQIVLFQLCQRLTACIHHFFIIRQEFCQHPFDHRRITAITARTCGIAGKSLTGIRSVHMPPSIGGHRKTIQMAQRFLH